MRKVKIIPDVEMDVVLLLDAWVDCPS